MVLFFGVQRLSERLLAPAPLDTQSRTDKAVRLLILSANIPGGQVFTNHQRYLKYDSVIKFAQIQTCLLFDFLQAIHQSIAVDKQLTGSLRHIQIVLKELIDGKEGLLVQRVNGILLKDLSQEDVAQGRFL